LSSNTWTGQASEEQDNTLTSSYVRYTQTFTVASNATQLGIKFVYTGIGTAGANDGYIISGIQLEVGGTATSYIFRHIESELALCERYFEKSYNQSVDPGTVATAGQHKESATRNIVNETPGVKYSVVKRGTPTVTIFAPGTGNSGNVTNSGDKVAAAATSGTSGFHGVDITAGTTAAAATYHFTSAAEL